MLFSIISNLLMHLNNDGAISVANSNCDIPILRNLSHRNEGPIQLIFEENDQQVRYDSLPVSLVDMATVNHIMTWLSFSYVIESAGGVTLRQKEVRSFSNGTKYPL